MILQSGRLRVPGDGDIGDKRDGSSIPTRPNARAVTSMVSTSMLVEVCIVLHHVATHLVK